MICEIANLDRQPLEESVEQWHAEQDEIVGGLQESMAALEAYQSHLDTWQQQLVAERIALSDERTQLTSQQERLVEDRSNFELQQQASGSQSEELALLRDQLAEARDRISSLSADLLAKSEELRTLDKDRAEISTQLELSRAREQNLVESLEREKRHLAGQHAERSEELQPRKELPDRQPVPSNESPSRERSNDPVVGSIVAQFDKLRQQQALGRRAQVKK